MLTLHNISKQLGKTIILDNVSLSIQEKSIIGLAGPSGSGKTTLLRCIQKLETIDSGEIIINKPSGFMFQDFQLFPHMTVLNNLIYAPSLKSKKNERERAIQLLTSLGLENKLHTFPQQLSGGQKQRVALARSLMMDPEVLLCDEPTSGLDIASIADVITLLQAIRKMGVTIVIASHDLDFLTNISDQIIILKNGKITVNMNPNTIENPTHYLEKYY